MAQTVTGNILSGQPDRRVTALFAPHLALFGNGFGLAKGHAIRAHAFSSEIKALPHVRQFHAPAMVFAGRGAAVEPGSAFIARQFLHGALSFQFFES